MTQKEPAIGVLVVAYNAASTLANVLDRIPLSFRPRIQEVIVSDDSSTDATFLVGLGYKQLAHDLPLTVIRNKRNLGYGGNQKVGYRLAMDHGLDIVVLLHGDGQYAPELLPDMVEPIERDSCDAVFGSRLLEPGAALRGGMPLYKYLGNRVLTKMQNTMLGTNLSEFHSGYRSYSVNALRQIDFESNSDGFDFDTEIIIELLDQHMRILEIPIPTYYGDEICSVNGIKYAKDVLSDVLRYRMSQAGPDSVTPAAQLDGQPPLQKEYSLKVSVQSSHGRILGWLRERPPGRVLDLGCSSGLLAAEMERMGYEVTGVDKAKHPDTTSRMHRFVVADLDNGLPNSVGADYDVIVAADVLEHVREPEEILGDLANRLRSGGTLIVSIPNFSHWYPRIRALTGTFDYDDQGILDRGHLRFFTQRSFKRLVRRARLEIKRTSLTGIPFERLVERKALWVTWLARVDRIAATLWPNLFAYQFLFELVPIPLSDVVEVPAGGVTQSGSNGTNLARGSAADPTK